MVIRLPGTSTQHGPQPGPDPAWARFTRAAVGDEACKVSLNAYKPDITAYRVLGREPVESAPNGEQHRQRNSHNSSVYVSHVDRYRTRSSASLTRLPVVGEIAAGQYDVTVAFQEYDCLDYEGGVHVEKALARGGAYA